MARWFEHDRSAGTNNATSAQVDAIDLTLDSSPEPEQTCKAVPQQQQMPVHVKAEPRWTTSGQAHPQAPMPRQYFGQVKSDQRGHGYQHAGTVKPQKQHHAPGRPSVSPGRTINPTHLAMIIDTSSPHALREVLLRLCQMSPALSGAVARGLSPYSTYACSLVRQHGQPSPASKNSTIAEDRNESSEAYLFMQQKLGVQTPSHMPKSQIVNLNKPQISTPYHKTQQLTRLKDESDSELDMELNLPIPSSARQPKTPTVLQTLKPGSSTAGQPFTSSLQQSTRVSPMTTPRFKEMYCTQCHEPFEDENDTCFWHPEAKTCDDGTRICKVCGAPMDELGCQVDTHVRG